MYHNKTSLNQLGRGTFLLYVYYKRYLDMYINKKAGALIRLALLGLEIKILIFIISVGDIIIT